MSATIPKPGEPMGRDFVQHVLQTDKIRPPETLFDTSTDETLGLENVPQERYFSKEFHDLEVEKVWKKVWQMACWSQDIPNAGDVYVYYLADVSILVVRQPDLTLKAFINSCLHRGRQILEKDGHVSQLFCPYHGFSWNLDGTLKHIPSQWDFPHVEKRKCSLPEVRIEEWNGFAFVCLDSDAPSLMQFLENMPDQWKTWDFTTRFKSLHFVKHMKANWKVVQEAFMEAFHADYVHPQMQPFAGMEQAQYDVWPGQRHYNRAVSVNGFRSTATARGEMSEQQIVDHFVSTYCQGAAGSPKAVVPPGGNARDVMIELSSDAIGQMFNVDLKGLPASDVLDGVWYNVFPNFEAWPTLGYPLIYRFRPCGNNPDESLMDIMILSPVSGERPASAKTLHHGPDDKMEPLAGPLGGILDQDVANFPALQRGLKAMRSKGVILSKYQESRIRHFHRTLGEYVSR